MPADVGRDAGHGGRVQHVVYAYGAEAVNLDAADAIDGPSFDVVYNIHEGLVGLVGDR